MEIVVFEQNGSGQKKIAGISRYGQGLHISRVYAIDEELPVIVDEPERYIDENFSADLVLDFLAHPDLSEYLAALCGKKEIALVASGKKGLKGAFTPFTCCGLGRHKATGSYGEQFGFPELRVRLEGDRIAAIEVIRGAPCGATWQVLERVIGYPVEEALTLLPREVQYLCVANPSAFDPVSGKSALHYAGHVHRAALEKAIREASEIRL